MSIVLFSTCAGLAQASHGGGSPPPPPPPAAAPGASLSPSTVPYGLQLVGTNSAAQTVTLTNTGSAPLFINAMSQAGSNPLDFAETDDQCVGIVVAAGGSCTLSVIFKPVATGTRTATISVVDNAASSPQVITFTGTGTSPAGPTPLSVDTQFFSCGNGVCDLGAGRQVFVENFFSSAVSASGGTAPFAWSISAGALPSRMTMTRNGLIYGSPGAVGTFTFTVKVTDATGSTATQSLALTVTGPPPPSPPGCQHAPSKLTEPLSGAAIGGVVPSGLATADESQLTACGGFTTIAVSVRSVNEPNGKVLWVWLDSRPIGVITLNGGAGTMKAFNAGDFGVSFDHITIYDRPPPRVNAQPLVLAGGSFS